MLLICFDSVSTPLEIILGSSVFLQPGFTASHELCVEGSEGERERVNEVKINEAREHHHLKAVSSYMPHL